MSSPSPARRRPLVWRLDFADAGTYVLRYGDDGWALVHGADEDATADVAVTTDTGAWTRYLMTPPADRPADPPGVDLVGSARELDRFRRLLAPFPYSP